MPTPGYVFRDSGTTPPPEGDDEEREFREWKRTRSRASTVANRLPTAQPPSRPSTDHLGGRELVNHNVLVGGGLLYGEERHLGLNMTAAADGDDGDDFTREKLRSTTERLYSAVVVRFIVFGRDLSRLRSWQEPVHTAAFAAVYALAWLFNVLMPTLLLGLIVLIAVPEARKTVFPPAAKRAIDERTGTVPGPVEASKRLSSTTTASAATNSITKASLDKARTEPTEPPIRTHLLRPAMHALNSVSDIWERIANALSPTPPFSHNKRIELAAMLIPVFLLSLAITLQQITRATTLLFGLAFFSKPIIQRAIDLLDTHIPDWRTYLDPRSTLLSGVPNNAELAIVLRAAGANGAPMPPGLRVPTTTITTTVVVQ
ncbi:hypothetical protein DV737_g5357, partial [Chaetothyriales sp. CBS 132003]